MNDISIKSLALFFAEEVLIYIVDCKYCAAVPVLVEGNKKENVVEKRRYMIMAA